LQREDLSSIVLKIISIIGDYVRLELRIND
jgi:hypothetical protein